MYLKSYLFTLISIIICAIFITSCSGRSTRRIDSQPTLVYDEPEPIDADIDLPVHPPTVGPGSYRRVKPVATPNYDWSNAPSRTFDLDPATGRLTPKREERIPSGVFRISNSSTVYYSNGGAYCSYRSWESFQCMSPDAYRNFERLPIYSGLPSNMENHGSCTIPVKCR